MKGEEKLEGRKRMKGVRERQKGRPELKEDGKRI